MWWWDDGSVGGMWDGMRIWNGDGWDVGMMG